MSESHSPAAADPQELVRAQTMWHSFTRSMKFGALAIAAGVVVLAWITL